MPKEVTTLANDSALPPTSLRLPVPPGVKPPPPAPSYSKG